MTTLLGDGWWGLLAAAAIVQILLLARAMMSVGAASRRLTALEEDFRRLRAELPDHAAAAIDPVGAVSADLPVVEREVDTSRGPRLRGRSPRLARGQDHGPGASSGPVRVVGGLNT